MVFSFIKEILNSPDHERLFNYDESERQKAMNTEKTCQLMLSDNELMIIYDLFCEQLYKGNIDKNKAKIYIGIAKKIDKEIIERWNGKTNENKD